MKQFAKNILALGVTSALSLGFLNFSHAATYEVVDKGNAENLEYTYGRKQNNQGVMAVTGTNIYNFPVQFEYLDDNDFTQIEYLALTRQDYYFGLGEIEDMDSLKAGDPTANDLAWTKLYLQQMNTSNSNPNFEYQLVGDTAAMINLGGEGSKSTEICIFDTDFEGNSCTGTLTRSTIDVIEGITGSGVSFGNASAPFLPMGFTQESGDVNTYWARSHGQRGFYSPDNGATIVDFEPIETGYGGGVSAILDMNDQGTAVGYSSYKLNESLVEAVLDSENGCAEPNSQDIPYDICIQKVQSNMYYIQAVKSTELSSGERDSELLGLLITPDPEDERAFVSQAMAVNNNDIAVGFSYGWDSNDVTTPSATERMSGSYAVIFKDGEVFDFNQLHYRFNTSSVVSFSQANDINDTGLVVGFTHDIDIFVKKFFYVDASVPDSEMEVIMPKGFFNTSVSTAFAVNSSGVIVGEAQIESHNESSNNPRRTAGFMFDTASESPVIVDINTLLECNSTYNILKANDINDAGQISATAVVKSNSYDAKGVLIVDENGDAVQIDVVRAVLLNPIADGVVDDCGSTEEKVERQGASIGAILLFSLLGLFGLRRRKFNR